MPTHIAEFAVLSLESPSLRHGTAYQIAYKRGATHGATPAVASDNGLLDYSKMTAHAAAMQGGQLSDRAVIHFKEGSKGQRYAPKLITFTVEELALSKKSSLGHVDIDISKALYPGKEFGRAIMKREFRLGDCGATLRVSVTLFLEGTMPPAAGAGPVPPQPSAISRPVSQPAAAAANNSLRGNVAPPAAPQPRAPREQPRQRSQEEVAKAEREAAMRVLVEMEDSLAAQQRDVGPKRSKLEALRKRKLELQSMIQKAKDQQGKPNLEAKATRVVELEAVEIPTLHFALLQQKYLAANPPPTTEQSQSGHEITQLKAVLRKITPRIEALEFEKKKLLSDQAKLGDLQYKRDVTTELCTNLSKLEAVNEQLRVLQERQSTAQAQLHDLESRAATNGAEEGMWAEEFARLSAKKASIAPQVAALIKEAVQSRVRTASNDPFKQAFEPAVSTAPPAAAAAKAPVSFIDDLFGQPQQPAVGQQPQRQPSFSQTQQQPGFGQPQQQPAFGQPQQQPAFGQPQQQPAFGQPQQQPAFGQPQQQPAFGQPQQQPAFGQPQQQPAFGQPQQQPAFGQPQQQPAFGQPQQQPAFGQPQQQPAFGQPQQQPAFGQPQQQPAFGQPQQQPAFGQPQQQPAFGQPQQQPAFGQPQQQPAFGQSQQQPAFGQPQQQPTFGQTQQQPAFGQPQQPQKQPSFSQQPQQQGASTSAKPFQDLWNGDAAAKLAKKSSTHQLQTQQPPPQQLSWQQQFEDTKVSRQPEQVGSATGTNTRTVSREAEQQYLSGLSRPPPQQAPATTFVVQPCVDTSPMPPVQAMIRHFDPASVSPLVSARPSPEPLNPQLSTNPDSRVTPPVITLNSAQPQAVGNQQNNGDFLFSGLSATTTQAAPASGTTPSLSPPSASGATPPPQPKPQPDLFSNDPTPSKPNNSVFSSGFSTSQAAPNSGSASLSPPSASGATPPLQPKPQSDLFADDRTSLSQQNNAAFSNGFATSQAAPNSGNASLSPPSASGATPPPQAKPQPDLFSNDPTLSKQSNAGFSSGYSAPQAAPVSGTTSMSPPSASPPQPKPQLDLFASSSHPAAQFAPTAATSDTNLFPTAFPANSRSPTGMTAQQDCGVHTGFSNPSNVCASPPPSMGRHPGDLTSQQPDHTSTPPPAAVGNLPTAADFASFQPFEKPSRNSVRSMRKSARMTSGSSTPNPSASREMTPTQLPSHAANAASPEASDSLAASSTTAAAVPAPPQFVSVQPTAEGDQSPATAVK